MTPATRNSIPPALKARLAALLALELALALLALARAVESAVEEPVPVAATEPGEVAVDAMVEGAVFVVEYWEASAGQGGRGESVIFLYFTPST